MWTVIMRNCNEMNLSINESGSLQNQVLNNLVKLSDTDTKVCNIIYPIFECLIIGTSLVGIFLLPAYVIPIVVISVVILLITIRANYILATNISEKELELDKWESGGDVTTAKQRIIKCFTLRRTKLNLSNLGLTRLPPNIWKMTHLKEFNCCSNPLGELPESLSHLNNLTYLNCSRCSIAEIPKFIKNLTSLKQLIIYENEIHILPKEIVELKNLKYLSIGEIEIYSISEWQWLINRLTLQNCLIRLNFREHIEPQNCLVRSTESHSSSRNLPNSAARTQNHVAGVQEEFVGLYQYSANLGDADSQYLLGKCYENGIGVEENLDEALRLYQLAAEQNYAEAQDRLAVLMNETMGEKK